MRSVHFQCVAFGMDSSMYGLRVVCSAVSVIPLERMMLVSVVFVMSHLSHEPSDPSRGFVASNKKAGTLVRHERPGPSLLIPRDARSSDDRVRLHQPRAVIRHRDD